MPAKITFIKLPSGNKLKTTCDLVERFFNNGEKVLIHVNDAQQKTDLDKLLWTWKQNSFIPHKVVSDLEEELIEPVGIVSDIPAKHDFDKLILISPVEISKLEKFKEVIDFAEQNNASAIIEDRNRYKRYKEAQLELDAKNPGEYLAQVSAPKL